MEKSSDKIISLKEGYETMLHMLNSYYELTGSDDLTDILSGGEYLNDARPADSAFWYYWVEANEKLDRDGPLMKEFV